MKSLEPHVNVVRLLGSCSEKEPILVILEYVNRGKLQTYLRNSRAERYVKNMSYHCNQSQSHTLIFAACTHAMRTCTIIHRNNVAYAF